MQSPHGRKSTKKALHGFLQTQPYGPAVYPYRLCNKSQPWEQLNAESSESLCWVCWHSMNTAENSELFISFLYWQLPEEGILLSLDQLEVESKETDSIPFYNNDDEIGHISEILNCESSDDYISN